MNELRTESAERLALRQVLASRTFARADQLRHLLEFLCERSLSGQSGPLTEYIVGVEALGRRADYDPAADPVVRNRAHALRKKLDEYYATENPHAALRIHLHKGSYTAVFETSSARPPEVPEPLTVAPAPPRRRWVLSLALCAAGVAIGYVARGWVHPVRPPQPSPLLREIWGPLLAGDGNPLICIGSPAHLFVRPHVTRRSELASELNVEGLRPWYQSNRNLPEASNLFLLPTTNSALWGDAAAAISVGRMMTGAGVTWHYAPERVTPVASIRKRNLVVLGRPEYSLIAATLLAGAPYQITFDASEEEYVVEDRRAQGPEPKTYRMVFDGHSDPQVVYGIVTVMPSLGGTGDERTILISGTNSAGSQAAAEFMTSPEHLRPFREKLLTGRNTLPQSYQVLVRASSSATIPLSFAYAGHRIFDSAPKEAGPR